jgi:hypothetical protein
MQRPFMKLCLRRRSLYTSALVKPEQNDLIQKYALPHR